MLQQLKWETLESRRTKIQLCSTKLSITWWVFQLITILHHLRPGLEPHTQRRCYNITLGQTLWSSVSSPELYLPGIYYQQQLLRPSTWYLSNGGWLFFLPLIGLYILFTVHSLTLFRQRSAIAFPERNGLQRQSSVPRICRCREQASSAFFIHC